MRKIFFTREPNWAKLQKIDLPHGIVTKILHWAAVEFERNQIIWFRFSGFRHSSSLMSCLLKVFKKQLIMTFLLVHFRSRFGFHRVSGGPRYDARPATICRPILLHVTLPRHWQSGKHTPRPVSSPEILWGGQKNFGVAQWLPKTFELCRTFWVLCRTFNWLKERACRTCPAYLVFLMA